MRPRDVAGAGLVSVTLGAIGCGEPGRPAAVDGAALFTKNRVEAGDAWRRFLEPQELHAAWVPPAASLWRPFYKPTLIAAVAVVKEAAGPIRSPEAQAAGELAARLAETTSLADAAIFVDMPGEESVAWGTALLAAGFQPVVTFNNWPHQKGLLRLELPLGALIFHAERARGTRPAHDALPVFLLERGRLGDRSASPGPEVFDNRYFHSAGDFPDAARLRSRGIKRIVYVNPRSTASGVEEDDLNAYFHDLEKAGLHFTYVVAKGGGLAAEPSGPDRRTTIFEPEATAGYAQSGTSHYHRPFGHYCHYHSFWTGSSGTWGSGLSGGGGSSGWSS
jgi:hypothetical protein